MLEILDNPQAIYQLDSTGVFKALWNLPDQCREAWQMGLEVSLPGELEVKNIVVTGLGGSAIGGDLLRVYVSEKISSPVIVNRDYTLPGFVNQDTLVFAVSYSGNTEETLSSYAQARDRKAKIIVITTGGKLKEMAVQDGFPVITVPGGIAPRAATGYLFIPTLSVLQRMGLISGLEIEINELTGQLKSMRERLKPEIPVMDNLSKQLAGRFYNHIPVIWGSNRTTEVVAQRWKGQINENSKATAYWNVFPELNHNEIVGFEKPKELLQKLYIVILRDKDDHPRIQKRMEITQSIIGRSVSGIKEINSSGEGILARTYSLIYIGDYASVYLAILYGVDPGPVRVIDKLKTQLAMLK